MKERIKTSELVSEARFFADITGLNITESELFPELQNKITGDRSAESFTFSLTLSGQGGEYKILAKVEFSDRHTDGDTYMPTKSWGVAFNGRKIFSVGGMTNISGEVSKKDLTDPKKARELVMGEYHSMRGGPDTEVPFMDFENITLESLSDKDSYFQDIYLAVMTHMKSRGVEMPPILSKSEVLRKMILAGSIDEVNEFLAKALKLAGGKESRIKSHIVYESEVIRERTKWEADKRNPAIPLADTFSHLDVVSVETGRKIFGPATILLVENDLYHYGRVRDELQKNLQKDGRFKGVDIITEVNLSACMQLAETGRIDLIIFDWTNPSREEMLMFRNKESLFDEYDEPDIRNKWMDMIADSCQKSGVKVPQNFILRTTEEMEDITTLVANGLSLEA